MLSPTFIQQALQQYLAGHASFYSEQVHVWFARLQSASHLDKQTLMTLLAPFQQLITISSFKDHSADVLVEYNTEAPFTLRLILSDSSLFQQIATLLVSRAVLDAYVHTVG